MIVGIVEHARDGAALLGHAHALFDAARSRCWSVVSGSTPCAATGVSDRPAILEITGRSSNPSQCLLPINQARSRRNISAVAGSAGCFRVIAFPPPGLDKSGAAIKPQRRNISFFDFQKDRAHAKRHQTSEMVTQQRRAQRSGRDSSRQPRPYRISASSAATREIMKPANIAADRGAMRDHVAVESACLRSRPRSSRAETMRHAVSRSARRLAQRRIRDHRRTGRREEIQEPSHRRGTRSMRSADALRRHADKAALAGRLGRIGDARRDAPPSRCQARRRSSISRRMQAIRPELGHQPGTGADKTRRRTRPQHARLPRAERCAATAARGPRAEQLEIDMSMTSVDRGRNRGRSDRRRYRVRQALQRRDTDGWLVGGKRDAARSGDADAQTGEAAGTDRHRDAVEREEVEPRLLHHALDQRHRGFRMAACHDLGCRLR